MERKGGQQAGRGLAVLHPVFALTGVVHAIGGSLLPSLLRAFHLRDNQAGVLLFLYFAGTSLGALLCTARFARTMMLGFFCMAASCVAVALTPWPLLLLVFLTLGVSVGAPMTAVNLFAGRNFPHRRAAILSFLNLTWSAGALAAPLLAGWVLRRHSYRAVYLLLAFAALVAAFACLQLPADAPEPPSVGENHATNLRIILAFALAAFLQVGAENTAAAWLSTYALRSENIRIAIAAVASSLYWVGFLASRAVASLLLLRVHATLVLRSSTTLAVAASLLLVAAPTTMARSAAMLLLGIALAPIYPLLVSGSLAQTRAAADSRWVLAAAGLGGSALPWLAGSISAQTGSLRIGMMTLPAALLLMILLFSVFPPESKNL
jgi:MFS transporter, FHS family, glucose/mannose:H+ symporter